MSCSNIDGVFLDAVDGSGGGFGFLGTDFRDFLGDGHDLVFDQMSEDGNGHI